MRKPVLLPGAVAMLLPVLLAVAVTLSACQAALPLPARPGTGQAPVTTPVVATQEFVHPTWGMSFQYPADWSLDIPDFEALSKPPPDMPSENTFVPTDLYVRTLGHGVTLYPTQEGATPDSKIEISLDTFTVSPRTSLEKWLTIRHMYGMQESPFPDRTKITRLDASDCPFAHVAEQVECDVVTVDTPHLFIKTVWLAKGELVYAFRVYTDREETVHVLEQVVSSVKFDESKLAELRAIAPFGGDESAMSAYIESNPRPKPTSTPESNSQVAPAVDLAARRPSMYQKALPSQWSAPFVRVVAFTVPATCTSPKHTDQAEFAVDAITAMCFAGLIRKLTGSSVVL